jgi:hypothetical protein
MIGGGSGRAAGIGVFPGHCERSARAIVRLVQTFGPELCVDASPDDF